MITRKKIIKMMEEHQEKSQQGKTTPILPGDVFIIELLLDIRELLKEK